MLRSGPVNAPGTRREVGARPLLSFLPHDRDPRCRKGPPMSPRQALCATALVASALPALACSGTSPLPRPAGDAAADSQPRDKTDGPRDPAKEEPDFRQPAGEFLADVDKL